MKKYIGVIMSIIFIVGIIGGLLFTMGVFGERSVAKAKGIHLNTTELDLKLKGNYQLNLDYELETQARPKVIYVSDNPDVVRVNELTGYLEARNYGMAEITVMVEDDPTINDTCYVYVTDKKNVTKINVKETSIEIGIGESKKIDVEVTPVSARPNLTWTSNDESIATVKNGMVRGIKEGETVVEIKEKGGRATRVSVKVKNVEIQEIRYNNAINQIHEGESKNLNIIYVPSNATKKDLIWESSDESVISVEKGKIKGIKEGRAVITARTEEGKEVSTEIEVIKRNEKVLPTGIKLDINKAKINKEESIKINATLIPNNAENKSLTWTSSDNNIATVNNGTIRGIKEGTTKIKVKTTNGIEKEIEVEVQEKTQEVLPTGVSIKEKTILLEPNKEKIITATVSPSNAGNKSLVWTSDNEKVAIVNSQGKVTTIKEGSANITAKTINGKTATIKVMVAEKEVEKPKETTKPTTVPTTKPTTPSQVEVILNKTNITLTVGESETLKATVNGSNQKVTWLSSNSNIATVDTNGKVVAKAKGTVTIIGKINGGKAGTCTVTVKEKNSTMPTSTPTIKPTSTPTIKPTATPTIKPTAIPTPKIYKVTFNPDNGTNSITMEVKQNGTVTPPSVTKSGYIFLGWYDGNTKFNASTIITKNMSLTAKWNKKSGKVIRVGTFNVGYFRCGSYTGASCNTNEYTMNDILKNKAKLDIMGMQEATYYDNGNWYTYVIDRLSNTFGFQTRYVSPAEINAIVVKKELTIKSHTGIPLKSCQENRALSKSEIMINDVKVSVYVTHFSPQSQCLPIHFAHTRDILNNDPNPIIIMGDFNTVTRGYFDTYFKPLGFELAAYDTSSNNMWNKSSYCDSIWVKSNDHIIVGKQEVFQAFKSYSDHNLVIANLEIVK